MPLLTPEQCAAVRRSAMNRSILPPLRRSSTPTGVRKNCSSAMNAERLELCRWIADKSSGKQDHKDRITWFEQKFGHILFTSIISDYLSKKQAHLDPAELTTYELSLNRSSTAEYKELEGVTEFSGEIQLRDIKSHYSRQHRQVLKQI